MINFGPPIQEFSHCLFRYTHSRLEFTGERIALNDVLETPFHSLSIILRERSEPIRALEQRVAADRIDNQ
jgi:hypothetical protein